jgi:hypothetical protein
MINLRVKATVKSHTNMTKKHKARIIPYSPKNRNTKDKLLISVLNPLISSLSPSIKSNGARLQSIINNTPHNRKSRNLNVVVLLIKEGVVLIKNITRRILTKVTSYATLCRMLRDIPSLAKELITDQLLIITEYEVILNKITNPRPEIKVWLYFPIHGINTQHNINIIRTKAGPNNKAAETLKFW